MEKRITEARMKHFADYLIQEERSVGTVEKYLRDIRAFAGWLGEQQAKREYVIRWREHLLQKGYAPVTINSMLSSLNGFFRFLGWEECRGKFLRIQKRMFRKQEKELNREEYEKLLLTARSQGRERLSLVMETICSTGIRVSEVLYITVEAVRNKRAEIFLKGKIRTILLPKKLCRKLLKYAQRQKITSGEIFRTRSGKSLSRHQIWKEMKELCACAGVESSKVFPHNLRHLFAVTFHRVCRDITKLADVLGHNSIETTRIYLLSTGKEHVWQLERLGLVS